MTPFLKATDAMGEAIDDVTKRITKGVGTRLEWVTVDVDIDCDMVTIAVGIKLRGTKYTQKQLTERSIGTIKITKSLCGIHIMM